MMSSKSGETATPSSCVRIPSTWAARSSNVSLAVALASSASSCSRAWESGGVRSTIEST